jgi:hypothetical protein
MRARFDPRKVQSADSVLAECKGEHNVADVLAKSLPNTFFNFSMA